MNKKSISVDKFFERRRSEIIKKFTIDEEIKNQVTETELMFIIKMIEDKNEIINNIKPLEKKVKLATLEERRSEITGKFLDSKNSVLVNKKTKEEKVKVNRELKDEKATSLKDVEKYLKEKRSEVISKVNLKSEVGKEIKEEKLNLIIKEIEAKNEEIANKEPVKKNVKAATLEEKRSEIVGKVILEKARKKKVKKDDLNKVDNNIKNLESMRPEEINEQKLEQLEDEVQEDVEKISIAMIIIVVLVCSIVGTIIGYMLYKIAMNNSNVVGMIFRYLI